MSKNKSSSGGKKGTTSSPLDVVMTVGLPGSGKSTLSKLLVSQSGGKWVHVSQDELGTQDECRKAIAKALKHRQPIVFDRCCVLERERRLWLQCFRDCPGLVMHAVFFDVPPAECLRHTTHIALTENVTKHVLKNRQREDPRTRKAPDAERPGSRQRCGRLCTEPPTPSAPGRFRLRSHCPQQRGVYCPLQATHLGSCCTKARRKTKVNTQKPPLFRHQPMKGQSKQDQETVRGFFFCVCFPEAIVND